MEPITTFGDWLREQRKASGYTQQELGDLIGCSVATMRKLESGERRPSPQVAELLAERFEVPETERAVFFRFARTGLIPEHALPAWSDGRTSSSPDDGSASSRPEQDEPRDVAPGNDEHSLAASSEPLSTSNLPRSLTPLIGREADIATLRALLLRENVRLITLTGPPGIGKTRLGVGLAASMLDIFGDGAVFVPLAPISDPALVPVTVGQVLGVQETAGQPLMQGLAHRLREARTLLVLDNFEQVISAAPFVADLLVLCPMLKVLVTSRESLHIRGEHQFPVPPLDLPLEPGMSVEQLRTYAAVELFLDRAQSVRPDFHLTPENAQAVADLCARLDGLPLAIELAAARIKLFSPEGMLARLEHRLSLLTSGLRDLPVRHKTLHAAIAWSYDLLDSGEKTLFARLSVFVGGCTLGAIEAVCNSSDDLPFDALEGVQLLLDKSLLKQEQRPVQAGGDGELRITMLEMVREFATEQLEASGEAPAIQKLHGEYYMGLSQAAELGLWDREQPRWLRRLDAENENLRAALGWLVCAGETDMAARIASGIWWFWYLNNYTSEARGWLETILAAQPPISPYMRVHVLRRIGFFAWTQGDLENAVRNLEAAYSLAQDIGDVIGSAASLGTLALANFGRGDPDAYDQLVKSVELARASGDETVLVLNLTALGNAQIYMGRFDLSEPLFAECLRMYRATGNKFGIAAMAGLHIGRSHRFQERFTEALEVYREGLGLFEEIRTRYGVALCLAGVADCLAHLGDPRKAARIFGAAETVRDSIGGRLDQHERADYEGSLAYTRSLLSEADFAEAWEEGRSLSHEQAVALGMG